MSIRHDRGRMNGEGIGRVRKNGQFLAIRRPLYEDVEVHIGCRVESHDKGG
jgi:hypothetical protein